MTNITVEEVEEALNLMHKQNYLVVKSNQLIQKSRFELSVPEQRAIAYICSMIKPRTALDRANKSPYVLEYEFDIREYADVCGIENNGRMYEETKSLLRGLIQKVYWITLNDGTETTINWIQKVWTNKRSGKVKILLDEDIAPYLFDLQERFTAYALCNILKMKSQYSIRLYEILESYEWLKSKTFKVDELKSMLMVDDIKTYDNFNNFKVKILDKAMKEINSLTDLHVTMEKETRGRKVSKVKFRFVNQFKEEFRKERELVEKMYDTLGL